MSPVFEKAYAKLNLTLDVIGKREDGYHDLDMIMQTVSLSDTVSVRRGAGDGIRVMSNLGYLPSDERNIAYVAAQVFFAQTGVSCDGLSIVMEKRIPVAAGMAGGSADGAAVLRALNRIYETNLSLQELAAMGKQVGADVPYCVFGGTMRARGIGEVLDPLPAMPNCYLVLCKPQFGMSTARVFGALALNEVKTRPDTERVIRALEEGDLSSIARGLSNVLEPVVAQKHAEISNLRRNMIECGALGACMSGSGSTVFGIFESKTRAQMAVSRLKKRHKDTFLTEPVGVQHA
ncbi:MAG: 4-(cytidine 5'-diphospho)-2-C-methyl-D-erythritol kinase [Oscillospiraceae bacterium]|nr:4-(cytidine 5'-diphospho)-2-C-methyl-D-erythritol kinase [Oscillospiraceae bacterium]